MRPLRDPMTTIQMIRFCYAPFGTYGRLYLPDGRSFWTVEQPWRDNESNRSCIPEGRYDMEPHNTEKYPNTWAFVNSRLGVYHWPADRQEDSERFACVIHVANAPDDVEGCVGPGKDVGLVKSQWAVTHSGDAMRELQNYLGRFDNFYIHIHSLKYPERLKT